MSTQGTSKNRALSRHSFSSETQSLPPTPPLSPNTMRRRIDKYDIPDDAMSSVSKRDVRHSGQHTNHFDNYRSFNDLMRPDLFNSRRSSFFDYPSRESTQQHQQQRVRRLFSLVSNLILIVSSSAPFPSLTNDPWNPSHATPSAALSMTTK